MCRATLLSALVRILLVATVLVARPNPSDAQATNRAGAPSLVLLVRHAEKAAEPASDPPLTAAGAARAQALAAALRDAGVTAIITTQLRRTRETAQPLAMTRGLTPEVVPISRGAIAAHVEAAVAAVRRHAGGVVLVVGHNNSVPAIIAALGGPRLPDICESVYASLFVLVPGGGEARLVRSHYGAADSDPGRECK
jgi:broad specificity phosphatase PhoE